MKKHDKETNFNLYELTEDNDFVEKVKEVRTTYKKSISIVIAVFGIAILVLYSAMMILIGRATCDSFTRYETVNMKIVGTSVDIPDDAQDSPSNGSKFMTKLSYNGVYYFVEDYDLYNHAKRHEGDKISRDVKITYHKKSRPEIELLEERGLK